MTSTIRSWLVIQRRFHVSRIVCSSLHRADLVTIQEKQQPVTNNFNEDLSEITPYFPESFNLAAYANQSVTLQNLINLNVNLSNIEKKPHIVYKILKLDFENDIKKSITFLKDYVELEKLGNFISKNPLILSEPLDDLEVRINYLKLKKFNTIQLKEIITKNPFWLMYSTVRIDKRLGFFQQKFNLSGNEVRQLASLAPRIITYNLHHINTSNFMIKEELGFSDEEMKQLILCKPKIWMINHKALQQRFNYIHNEIQIPHNTIRQQPNILLCRNFIIKQRHSFLHCLGRAQYDPTKENYVPITALFEGTDLEFCKDYAKCTIDVYNTFLKTL